MPRSRETGKRAPKKPRQKQAANSKARSPTSGTESSSAPTTASHQVVDTNTEPKTLRRSARSQASKATSPPTAAHNGRKKKPGYIYVPIQPDDDVNLFDIPPRRKGSRVGLNARRASQTPEDNTPVEPEDNAPVEPEDNAPDSPADAPSNEDSSTPPLDAAHTGPSAPDMTVNDDPITGRVLGTSQPQIVTTRPPRPRPRQRLPAEATEHQHQGEYEPIGPARQSMVFARSLASSSVSHDGEMGTDNSHPTPTTTISDDSQVPHGRQHDAIPVYIERPIASCEGGHDDHQPTIGSVGGVGAHEVLPTVLGAQGEVHPVSSRTSSDVADSESTGSSSTLRSPPPSSSVAIEQLPSSQIAPQPPLGSRSTPRSLPSPSSGAVEQLLVSQQRPNHPHPQDDDSDDSSGDSGSDYSEKVSQQRQKRISKAGHEDVDYSEQEDEEEDLRLADDVVAESDGPEADGQRHKSSRSRKRKGQGKGQDRHHGRKKSDKAKGKERAAPDDTDIADLNDDHDREAGSQGRKNKPGPLSQEAKEKIAAAGAEFRALLQGYSAEYGKDISEIAFTAGWAIRSERKQNLYNIYKRWYPYTHEKDDDMSFEDWNKEMDSAYKKQFEGIDRDDPAARREIMQPIIDELAGFEEDSQGTNKVSSALSRVRRCKEQFVNMAKAYNNLQDLHVGGFIVYTGSNPSAKMHSVFFTGSDAMADLAKANDVSYGHILDCIESGLRTIVLQKTTNIKLPVPVFGGLSSAQTAITTAKTKRDLFRAALSAMLREEYNKHVSQGKTVKDFPWSLWPEKAYDQQLCLMNWPANVPCPGADFKFKELTQTQLENLLGPVRTKAALRQWDGCSDADTSSGDGDESDVEIEGYHRRDAAPKLLKDIEIVPWNDDDKALNAGNPAIQDIPLVVSRSGQVLRVVKDTKGWMKGSKPKTHRSRKRRAYSPVSVGAPEPTRSTEPVEDRSQRPAKRPRLDPTTHLHQVIDVDSEVQDPPRDVRMGYNSRPVHERPASSRRMEDQQSIPVVGPSRVQETANRYSAPHVAHGGGSSMKQSDIDTALAAARAKLVAVKKRHEDQAKLAELQKIQEAILRYGDDDEYSCDLGDVF